MPSTAGDRDRDRRDGVSFLQYRQAAGRFELAQSVLRRPVWRAGGIVALLACCGEAARPRAPRQWRILPASGWLAWCSVGLLGTAAEAALLHFRGAYHNPAMLIPVTAGPVAAALLALACVVAERSHVAALWSLRLLTAIGFVGAGFHAYGVQRNMGGWRNWSQNLLNGPPLPAPPAFTALAIAGLAALRLIEERHAMTERFPGYDVLAKRHTPSWNEQTRAGHRPAAALPREPRFLSRGGMADARGGLRPHRAAARRRAAGADRRDGRRRSCSRTAATATAMTACRRCTRPGGGSRGDRRGGARAGTASAFDALDGAEQDALLQRGAARARSRADWEGMDRAVFFAKRAAARHRRRPITRHPTAWNEIGFGGPASPRGYVRMDFDRRDPWEAAEAKPGHEGRGALRENSPCRMTRSRCRAARTAARPTCSACGGWMPMREYPRERGGRFRDRRHRRGRRHARLPAGRGRLFGRRFRCRAVVAAARGFRLRRNASAEALLDRRAHLRRRRPAELGANNSGQSVGGSTVHFAMVSLRFRAGMVQVAHPARLRRRLADRLARDVALLRRGRAGAENLRPGQLSVGPKAPALSLSAARAECRGAGAGERLPRAWASPGRRRRSPRSRRRAAGRRPASIAASASSGCSTNAKQSALVTWIPRAVAAGAEIRDLAMVGRIETDPAAGASPACIIAAKAAGAFSGRRTSSSPAMRSRPRGCC